MSIKDSNVIIKDGRWVDRRSGALVTELTYDEVRLCTKCSTISHVSDAECCQGR